MPTVGTYKCNPDDAVKRVSGPSIGPFCIRNDEGNLIYVKSFSLTDTSVPMSKAVDLRRGWSIVYNIDLGD